MTGVQTCALPICNNLTHMTMVLHSPRTPWCVKDLLQADKAFCEGPALIPIVGYTRNTERGGESVCAVFINLSTFIIKNLFNIMHYHIIIISSSTLLSSSYHHHHIESIATQYTIFLRGNPSPRGKTTEAFLK